MEQGDAERSTLWPKIEGSVVRGECRPFDVGVVPEELIVLRDFDVQADGRKKAGVPSTRVVGASVGYVASV